MPLHPDCLGLSGTVESYLESQGALPYFWYDQVYSAVYKKIIRKHSASKSAAKAPSHPCDLPEADSGAASPGSLAVILPRLMTFRSKGEALQFRIFPRSGCRRRSIFRL